MARLEHTRLTVHNLEACIAFYQELFGLKIRWEGQVPSGERWVHLGTETHYLSLSQASSAHGKRQHPGRYEDFAGYTHMGWVVEDLAACKARLQALGVEDIVEKTTAVGQHIYVFDPHGNEVELIEYTAA